MKTIFKKTIGLTLSLVFVLGCSDDNLDIDNPNQLSAGNFYTNIGNLNNALTGVYDAQVATELFGFTFMPLVLYALPKTQDEEFVSLSERNEFMINEVTENNPLLPIVWRAFYRGVARSNDFLVGSEAYRTSDDVNEGENARILEMQGEAYWHRAFDYFHLVRLWGEANYAENPGAPGVPLVLDIATIREEMNIPRATVGEVYDRIVSDLLEAESRLPDSWSGDDIARVDAIAAKALLGQVYLYQENYEAARQEFEEVINSDLALVPFSEYDALFHGENEFSSESIFEFNFSLNRDMNAFRGGPGQTFNTIIAPKGTGFANNYPHDQNILRFGDDPRLKIVALEPGVDSITLRDGSRDVVAKYVEDPTALGWSFRKYTSIGFAANSQRNDSGANVFVLRLADVYLMYAEVLNALGNDTGALEYLNKVRRRAYGGDPDTAGPNDLTGLAGDGLRDAIREERFLELFGEGHRWYDIRRWGIIQEELAKYPTTRVGPPIYNPQDAYLPIPLDELNTNPMVEQSTGY